MQTLREIASLREVGAHTVVNHASLHCCCFVVKTFYDEYCVRGSMDQLALRNKWHMGCLTRWVHAVIVLHH